MTAASRQPKASEALSVLFGGTLAASLALLGPTAYPGQAMGLLLPFLGLGSGAAAVGLHKRHGLSKADYQAGSNLAIESAKAAYRETGITEMAVPMIRSIALSMDLVRQTDTALIRQHLVGHSLLITAPTGVGKSFFASILTSVILQEQPNASFFIATPTPWKRGHSWCGLKFHPELHQQFVTTGKRYADKFKDISIAIYTEMRDAIAAFHELTQKRMRESNDKLGEVEFSPVYLILDELPGYTKWLKQNGQEDEISKIDEILQQGHGLKVFTITIAQSQYVGDCGISEAVQRNLFKVALSPGDSKSLKYFPGDVAALVAEASGLRGRSAVIATDRASYVMQVPELESEPQIDWSLLKAAKDNPWLQWLEAIAAQVQQRASEGTGLSTIWKELVTRLEDFPEFANRRASRENEFYAQYMDHFGGSSDERIG